MYGKRLVVGSVFMLTLVPLSIMFLLDQWSLRAWFVIAMTAFSGWGVGDLVALLLTRDRDSSRTARDLLRAYTAPPEEDRDESQ